MSGSTFSLEFIESMSDSAIPRSTLAQAWLKRWSDLASAKRAGAARERLAGATPLTALEAESSDDEDSVRLSLSLGGPAANEPAGGVEWTLPAWSASERKRFAALIRSRPLDVARMRADRMSGERLLELAHDAGLDLFAQPSNVRRRCDCGRRSSVRPCTHEAALIGAAAERIARDPRFALELRGFRLERDLPEAVGSPTTLPARGAALAEAARRVQDPAQSSVFPSALLFDRDVFGGGLRTAAALVEEAAGNPERMTCAFAGVRPDVGGLRLERPLSDRPQWALGGKPLTRAEAGTVLLGLAAHEGAPVSAEERHALELARFTLSALSGGLLAPLPVIPDEAVEHPAPRLLWLPDRTPGAESRMRAALAKRTGWASLAEVDPSADADKRIQAGLSLASEAALALLSLLPLGEAEADPAAALLLGRDLSQADGFTSGSMRARIARPFERMLRAFSRPVSTALRLERSRGSGFQLSFAAALTDPHAQGSAADLLRAGALRLQDALERPELAPHAEALRLDALEAAEALPPLEALLEAEGERLPLELEAVHALLADAAPELERAGVPLLLPKSLRRRGAMRIYGELRTGAGSKPTHHSFMTEAALAEFEWKAAVGDRTMTLEELAALVKTHPKGGLIEVGDDYVYVDAEEAAKILSTGRRKPSAVEKLRALLTEDWEGRRMLVSEELRGRLAELLEVGEVPPPEGFAGTLRPYQARGFAWLVKNMRLGIGSLLADDMGLGKTVQVIAAILAVHADGLFKDAPALVVAPTGVLTNWEREFARFAPSLRTAVLQSGADADWQKRTPRPDVVLTSYGMLRRDIERWRRTAWPLLVLDEAQAVKNASTHQAAAARLLEAGRVVAMTGTPVENRLMEYWSIFSIVQPGLLGTAQQFRRRFALPIEEEKSAAHLERFKRLVAPFMMRRVKTDRRIIADLPEKNSIDRFTTITKHQAALYAEVLSEHLGQIRALDGLDLDALTRRMRRRGMVLTLILRLKQICDSPSLYEGTRPAAADAGKAEALFEILDECRSAGRKVLVFTQFAQMGLRLQDWIETETGVRPDFLSGSVPRLKRAEMVDRFQTDPSVPVLIVSLKAGGVGLNLAAASTVVHYDLWWNPAAEDQATDRAYRIGQRRDVLVYRFITAGTFEEKINAMLAEKREISSLAVTAGESWIGDLADSELEDLFRLSDEGDAHEFI